MFTCIQRSLPLSTFPSLRSRPHHPLQNFFIFPTCNSVPIHYTSSPTSAPGSHCPAFCFNAFDSFICRSFTAGFFSFLDMKIRLRSLEISHAPAWSKSVIHYEDTDIASICCHLSTIWSTFARKSLTSQVSAIWIPALDWVPNES